MKNLIILLLFIPSMLFAQTYYVCTGPYAYAMHGSYDCANANCSKEVVSMSCTEAHKKGFEYCKNCHNYYSQNAKYSSDNTLPDVSGYYNVNVSFAGCVNKYNDGKGVHDIIADIYVSKGRVKSVNIDGLNLSCKMSDGTYPVMMKNINYCGLLDPWTYV